MVIRGEQPIIVDTGAPIHQDNGLDQVSSAHGPILRGEAIADAFDRVRSMAGRPITQPPGQALLDDLVAATLDAATLRAAT